MSSTEAQVINSRLNISAINYIKNPDYYKNEISKVSSEASLKDGKKVYIPLSLFNAKFYLELIDDDTLQVHGLENFSVFFKNSEGNEEFALSKDFTIKRKDINLSKNLTSLRSRFIPYIFAKDIFEKLDKKIIRGNLFTINFLIETKKAYIYQDLKPGISLASLNSMHGYFFGKDRVNITVAWQNKAEYREFDLIHDEARSSCFSLSEYPSCCGLMTLNGVNSPTAKEFIINNSNLINNLGYFFGFSRYIFVNHSISSYQNLPQGSNFPRLRKLIDFTNRRNQHKLGIFTKTLTKYV